MRRGPIFQVVLLGLGVAASAALADDAAPARVGRVAAVSGAVQYRSTAGDWSAALANEPIGAGAGLRSVRDGTARLAIADDQVALAGGSELRFVRLDRDIIDLSLMQGRIFVHLGGAGATRTAEIDLPGGAVWLAAPGDYDIAAGDAQTPARVEVFAGSAQVGSGLADTAFSTAAPDDFDTQGRAEAGRPAAESPLPPGITGGEALAANGQWETDDTFGDVWYPRSVAENWAPFRYGRWHYLPPWGWTWVDDAEWGFAPSHYGGWERINDRWAWVPGPSTDEPVFSPAAAAFIGTPGIGLSRPGSEGAAVGWFPLAPGETVGDGSNPHYRNRRFASVVPRATFAAGQPVQSALLDLPEWRLDDAPVITTALDIPPTAEGGSGFIAEATPAPVAEDARVISIPPLVKPTVAAVPAHSRQLLIARIHDVLASAARSSSHRLHVAALAFARPRSAPSTSAAHPPHNRRHLAAARRGGG